MSSFIRFRGEKNKQNTSVSQNLLDLQSGFSAHTDDHLCSFSMLCSQIWWDNFHSLKPTINATHHRWEITLIQATALSAVIHTTMWMNAEQHTYKSSHTFTHPLARTQKFTVDTYKHTLQLRNQQQTRCSALILFLHGGGILLRVLQGSAHTFTFWEVSANYE